MTPDEAAAHELEARILDKKPQPTMVHEEINPHEDEALLAGTRYCAPIAGVIIGAFFMGFGTTWRGPAIAASFYVLGLGLSLFCHIGLRRIVQRRKAYLLEQRAIKDWEERQRK